MNGDALAVASGLGRGVVEGESLSNRDFSINLHKENILSSCLAWIMEIAVVTADVIVLTIDCLKKRSISRLDGK